MATSREIWEAEFGANPPRDADFETMSGIPVEPVYGPADGEHPGQFPYTRGPYASMYRSRLWTMRMFAGFGTADDTNWRFKEIIRAGGSGLSTAFDMPTLLGIDSDDPMALGEVMPAFSWPDARHLDGRTASLELEKTACNDDDDIDWSPFDVLVFVSIPAW